MTKKSPTNETNSFVLNFLFKCGVYSYRQNTVGVYDARKGSYRSAPKTGLPDNVAILPPFGNHLGIEIKTGKDRLRPEQAGTIRNIERMGGTVLVVKDPQDFMVQWTKFLLRNEKVHEVINKYCEQRYAHSSRI